MIEIFLKKEQDNEFHLIPDFCPGCFIYVKNAKLEDLEKIDQLLSHEVGDIHGSIDKYEVPRMEKHGDNLVLFMRHPGEQDIGLHTEPLTLLLTKNYLIAISPYSNPLIDHMLQVNLEMTSTEHSKFLFYLLARCSHLFNTSIKQVRHSILLHEDPSKMIDSNAIISLAKDEEILNQYLTALVSMRNLLETLYSHHYLDLTEKERDQLQDLVVGISQSEELCHVNVKNIRSLRDSYQIIFTNDVNKTIKRLTAITIILSIPTMIASIYGMNVTLPFKDYSHMFLIILGCAIITSVAAMLIFIKNRWL